MMPDGERVRRTGSVPIRWPTAAVVLLSSLQGGCFGADPDGPEDLAGNDISQFTQMIYDKGTDTTRIIVSLSYEVGRSFGGIGGGGTQIDFRPTGADRLEASVDGRSVILEPVDGPQMNVGATVEGWPERSVTLEYRRGASVLRRLNVQLMPLPDFRLELERDVLSFDESLPLRLEVPELAPELVDEEGRIRPSDDVLLHTRQAECLSALSGESLVYEEPVWARADADLSVVEAGLSIPVAVERLIGDSEAAEGLSAGTISECKLDVQVDFSRSYNPPFDVGDSFVGSLLVDFPSGVDRSAFDVGDLVLVSFVTRELDFTVVP